MAKTIKQSQLRNDNAEIMRQVAAGESFTVTVNGVPVADLIPHQRLQKRRAVPTSELDALLAAEPPIDVVRWNSDVAALDILVHDAELGPPQEEE